MNKACHVVHHFPEKKGGFTLIEIMVAIGIMAVVLGMAMPAIYKSMRQEGISKATADIMEGCTQARAQAIIRGATSELVIRSEDGSLSVEMPSPGLDASNGGVEVSSVPMGEKGAFSARIPESVAVQMLDVNFVDHMEMAEARVRFHPNGTSDEFTIVLRAEDGGMRKISLEVVTGLPSMEVIR